MRVTGNVLGFVVQGMLSISCPSSTSMLIARIPKALAARDFNTVIDRFSELATAVRRYPGR